MSKYKTEMNPEKNRVQGLPCTPLCKNLEDDILKLTGKWIEL